MVACACNAEDAITASPGKCADKDEAAKSKVFHPTQTVVQPVVREYIEGPYLQLTSSHTPSRIFSRLQRCPRPFFYSA